MFIHVDKNTIFVNKVTGRHLSYDGNESAFKLGSQIVLSNGELYVIIDIFPNGMILVQGC